MKRYQSGLLAIIGMIVSTAVVLAIVSTGPATSANLSPTAHMADPVLALNAHMVQDKILTGGDGRAVAAVTLTAAQLPEREEGPTQALDMVIVLDRSGSMHGEKIASARGAAHRLIERLTAEDRLALVVYENRARLISPLVAVNEDNRDRLKAAVDGIQAGGGTNLGDGLRQGIDLLLGAPRSGRQRKVILISDGLANHGITAPRALGRMAAAATDHHFTVSTVGVGLDFNELLMTTIADEGTGRYYFLENPTAFARVFEQEFQSARQVAASGVAIRIPLAKGVRLVEAGGYPITMEDGAAVVHPGNLVSGDRRKIFLAFQVPAARDDRIVIGDLEVRYEHQGRTHALRHREPLTVACVSDEKAVWDSVDKAAWAEQVTRSDYSRLKAAVADAVRKGDAPAAEAAIQSYADKNRALNDTVGSQAVAAHLEKDVDQLRRSVTDTFSGAPAEVAAKQKRQSKALQFESYEGMRGKQ